MVKAKWLWKWLSVAALAAGLFLVLRSPVAAEDAVAPTEAAALIKQQKQLQLIDVRTEAEYANGHVAGAKLIPLHEVEKRLAEIDKQKPVLLYCRTGSRSANALKILQERGYTQAKHMDGGIKAWQAAGLPITK